VSRVGKYLSSSADPYFRCPLGDILRGSADESVDPYYQGLQDILYDAGYPETVDRSNTPITADSKDRITIVVLSSPLDCMGIVLEGISLYTCMNIYNKCVFVVVVYFLH